MRQLHISDNFTLDAAQIARLAPFGRQRRATVVVIVGDGAEWIWNRATEFVRRCEILLGARQE